MNFFRSILLGTLFAVTRAFPAHAATLTNDTLIAPGDLTYDGAPLVINGCVVTINGPHAFTSLRLTNGAVLTHSPADTGQAANRLNLSIAQDMSVDIPSRVDVSGRGWGRGTGPGAGASTVTQGGAGAGHGGRGGAALGGPAIGTAYDVVIAPDQAGSGGGSGYLSFGGAGGGVVKLVIGGTLRVDGVLNASGGYTPVGAFGGGGAGGTISITASNLVGYGSLLTHGGASTGGNGGGGAGGRIALTLTVNQFTGTLGSAGGWGWQYGAAGTVFVRAGGATTGDVRVSNEGHAGELTPWPATQPCNLTIVDRAIVYPLAEFTNANLTIKSNGLLTCLPGETGITVNVLGICTIEPGGRLDVSGKGYAAGVGLGAGLSSISGGGGGGGHGGIGGAAAATGGGGYDSVVAPTQRGSGGGAGYLATGGAGGGVARVVVGGALQVDGLLAADGSPSGNVYHGGGGAGGSLWLSVGTLRGAGSITANGGVSLGDGGGGGGGGRIAVYFQTNSFTGVMSASGGAGAARGGAGTLFTRASSASHGSVLVDNAGVSGGVTKLHPGLWPVGEYFDLVLAGGAQLIPEMPLTCWNFYASNGVLVTCTQAQAGVSLSVLAEMRVEAGATIRVDALGHGPSSGPGAGGSSTNRGGGGGGHGGVGGAWTNTAAGGGTYGSAAEPTTLGSGGGAGYLSRGGYGGGAIWLSVAGIFTLNGQISADGGPGEDYNYGGGGAGGSIYVAADVLTGTGSIRANGGASALAGGGGGGRIALYPRLLVGFTNVPSAIGGPSGSTNLAGLAGSVYYASNVAPLRVIAATPSGTVARPVNGVDVLFSAAVNTSTFTSSDVLFMTPTGAVSGSQVVITPLAGPLFNIGVPAQTNLGTYQVRVGPHIQNLAGKELDQNGDLIPGQDPGDVFTNTFTVVRPSLAGTVLAQNGWPVSGVTVGTADRTITVLTDTNGQYSLSLPVGWSGSISALLTGGAFTPASRSYPMLSGSLVGQDFTLATDLSPTLTLALVGTNAVITWPTLTPFAYQLTSSADLVSWQAVGAATNGNGSVVQRSAPVPPGPGYRSFRVQVLRR